MDTTNRTGVLALAFLVVWALGVGMGVWFDRPAERSPLSVASDADDARDAISHVSAARKQAVDDLTAALKAEKIRASGLADENAVLVEQINNLRYGPRK